MPDLESSAVTRAGFPLPSWAVACLACLVAAMITGCATLSGCRDCDVCATSFVHVSCVSAQALEAGRDATWFEGAALIDGSGGAPVGDSAFLVEDGVFAWVGRQGERQVPDGAERGGSIGQDGDPGAESTPTSTSG